MYYAYVFKRNHLPTTWSGQSENIYEVKSHNPATNSWRDLADFIDPENDLDEETPMPNTRAVKVAVVKVKGKDMKEKKTN